MKTKRLLSSTLLYGIGDLLVMAVSGFLLIPLYTRTLSLEEYGIYSILRTNTDLFTYAMHFGLISAVSRLYFDFKREGDHFSYLSSVLVLFVLILVGFCVLLALCGEIFWKFLSPQVPTYPYLLYCLGVAVFSFFSSFLLIWLRIENHVTSFVGVQVVSSVFVLLLVLVALVICKGGLAGLLWALLINALLTALLLPLFLWRKLRLMIRREHVVVTLRFAAPIVFGYFAYFLINRGSMLVLQRYVAVEEVAVFGLTQQIAAIVTLASTAFAKTLQPVIYSAQEDDLPITMERVGRAYFLVMALLSSLILLFSMEILSIAAPTSYTDGYGVFVLLLLANFVYSLNFISNSVLLYHRRSMQSVLITLIGGVTVLTLNLFLIPNFKLIGASVSMLFAAVLVLAGGFFQTRHLLENLNLRYVFLAIPVTALVCSVVYCLNYSHVGIVVQTTIKTFFVATIGAVLYYLYANKMLIRG